MSVPDNIVSKFSILFSYIVCDYDIVFIMSELLQSQCLQKSAIALAMLVCRQMSDLCLPTLDNMI